MPLLWFHAFGRLAVLYDGLKVSPRMTDTKQLELELGILPHALYCYLGRTLEVFGDLALALAPSASTAGSMSPFDSGGLVEKCPPVCDWAHEKKKDFLAAYTWPMSERASLLRKYPGGEADDLRRYLDPSRRPEQQGPHSIWPDKPEANIWELDRHWRGWTWEGRWPDELPIEGHVVGWSCAPARWADVITWFETEASDREFASFTRLRPLFVEGGVGGLIASLHARQVAP